jgi:hypothetical protein
VAWVRLPLLQAFSGITACRLMGSQGESPAVTCRVLGERSGIPRLPEADFLEGQSRAELGRALV